MTGEALKNISVPKHVGIIMDGNGRWAERRGLDRSEGHRAGAKTFRKICERALELGVETATFYAFSTENWKRPAEEVAAIMDLFREYLLEAGDREKENEAKGMRVRYIGEREGLPADIKNMMETLEKRSSDKNKLTVNLAVNYGGRNEILRAVRILAEKARAGEIRPRDITPKDIEDNLYTAGLPDPDLIIRPSGEYRLSNFLVWQSAYSEFWFSDILWPDFTPDDFDAAVIDYSKRNRRFGGV